MHEQRSNPTSLAPTVELAQGPGARRLTPMLEQYFEAKAAHPEGILMFRMGDFFEMFFEDAVIAARLLDLVLTSRDKDRGADAVPMAGVPHHAVASYIARLVEQGQTVVLCDQVEDPRKAKGLVRRAITRIVTPGTVSDLEALDPSAPTYLAATLAVGDVPAAYVIALLDLLAGEILCSVCDSESLADELRRMGVRELLVHESARDTVTELMGQDGCSIRTLPAERWPAGVAADALLVQRFRSGRVQGLPESAIPVAQSALATLITYAEATQRRVLPHLLVPRAYGRTESLVLDETTRRNLELVRTQLDGERRGSLLWHLDRCRTAIGSRRLAQWLLFPLQDRRAIEARLDVIGSLVADRQRRESLQRSLDGVRDIERLIGRVAIGRATPRDLAALCASLGRVPMVREILGTGGSVLDERWRNADDVADLRCELESALVDEPPVGSTDGGIFRRGYRADLDELISLSTESHGYLLDLEARERARTGISSLKVRYNRVFGYFIEVTRANLAQVPGDYERKQTLVGAERFVTPELKVFEDKVLSADERRKSRETELFEALVAKVADEISRLRALSRLIADTDALTSLAQVADEGRYVRPELCEEPLLELTAARHPVLERLMPAGERFVPNDLRLDARDRQLMVLTGPNMAGKSTVMRQVALCALLAHMGAFVPAKRARIGLTDRIFTRVGAADSLGKGLSTFMVEMLETATILKHATPRSLVVLDEIGRGTSTFDGVSIAWAVAEHLHDAVGCRTMFATHYHELTDLALERPRIFNARVAVQEEAGHIVFVRRVEDGAANRSYGIQVAQLAGLPSSLLARAREILANLERGELDERGLPAIAFSSTQSVLSRDVAPVPEPPPACSQLEETLRGVDPMHLTPMQALELVVRLKDFLA